MNNAHIARMLIDQRSKLPRRKLKATCEQLARQAMERDCVSVYGQSYADVMKRFDDVMTRFERGEGLLPEEGELIAFIGERAAFFNKIGEKLGIEIEV